jgi:hypothetical protein
MTRDDTPDPHFDLAREQEIWTSFAMTALECVMRGATAPNDAPKSMVKEAAFVADLMLDEYVARFGPEEP